MWNFIIFCYDENYVDYCHFILSFDFYDKKYYTHFLRLINLRIVAKCALIIKMHIFKVYVCVILKFDWNKTTSFECGGYCLHGIPYDK